MRNLLAIGLMTFILASALWIYWEQEFKNYLPVEQQGLPLNSKVNLDFANLLPAKPTFFHFYDDECKNARINIGHISKIIEPYENAFNFVIVVQNEQSAKRLQKQKQWPETVQVVVDQAFSLTEKLQIQTTPYAAILATDNTVYFRGNYRNNTGLCGPADIKWSAPALALQAHNKKIDLPLFQPYQLVAQGCRLN